MSEILLGKKRKTLHYRVVHAAKFGLFKKKKNLYIEISVLTVVLGS